MSDSRYSPALLARAAALLKGAKGEPLEARDLEASLDRLADAYESSLHHVGRIAGSPDQLLQQSLAATDRLRELCTDEADEDWLRLVMNEARTLARLHVEVNGS